jgi:SAM-dependent methyltransferase
MEIGQTFWNSVLSLVEEYNKSDDYELEARYTGLISRLEFDRCIEYCQNLGEFTKVHEEVLDILTDNYRVTISGNDTISAYCKSNLIDEAVIIQKNKIRDLKFEQIDFKINLKQELEIDPDTSKDLLENLHALDKSYRYKKRYSFTHLEDKIRIDLTVLKESYGNYPNFVSSKVISKPEKYEIEIEVIGKGTPTKKLASGFLDYMLNLYRIIVDEEYICTKAEKLEILKEYFTLCYNQQPTDYQRMPRRYFVGPQPVTLEKKNLDNTSKNICILNDYTVTEKADGERCLLFVNKSGRCYFINNRLNIKFCGVTLTTIKNTLLDGEYITNDLINNYIKYYAIFDVYYSDEQDIRALPLIGKKSRISIAQDFVKKAKTAFEKEEYEIATKEFLSGPNILVQANQILSKEIKKEFKYKIDGLIFTPISNPVGTLYKEQEIKPHRHEATWHAVFKWKPPEDNTIDFLVKYKKGSSGNPILIFVNNEQYRILELYVGYKPGDWIKIDAKSYLDKSFKKSTDYIEKLFRPGDEVDELISYCYIPVKQAHLYEDESIIEFRFDYHETKHISLKWVPVRVRTDKTETYKKTKSIGGAANDFKSALNVWRSITYPITKEIITGKVKELGKLPPDDDVYYDRYLARDAFASKEMMRYHNYIKNELIAEYKSESVFDMACGKGGDLGKFFRNNFTRILGYDSSMDNIVNPFDGAYSRLDKLKSKIKTVFLTYDLSEVIKTSNFKDPNDKLIAQVLYGEKDDITLHSYYEMAKNKFDLVSCQFAIHYFFENETKLDNFLTNVDMHIKPGGYFIGTCLDGIKVKDALVKKTEIQGKQLSRVLWSITKLYTNEKTINYGDKIDVFMESIGRVFTEYLVNKDILEKKLNKKGFELVSYKNFQEYLTDDYKLSDQEQEYSFLNMTFVFKKTVVKPRVFKKKVPAIITSTE